MIGQSRRRTTSPPVQAEGFVARSQAVGERLGSGGCEGLGCCGWVRSWFGLNDSREPGDFA
ncbi:MAG: hypothetical protein P8074_26690 [Anaerolineales bacterium]